MYEKKQLLAEKIKIQQAKNKLKLLEGIQVLVLLEHDENITLHNIFEDYRASMCSQNTAPYSKLSENSSSQKIYSWIISVLHLANGQIYFFWCAGIWTKIKIVEVQTAVANLWHHDKNEQGIGPVGFLLVDEKFHTIMEVGSDSRDESHYLIDFWSTQQAN